MNPYARKVEPEPLEVPPPVVMARPATEAELDAGSIRTLVNAIDSTKWSVVYTYSSGYRIAKKEIVGPHGLIAVRLYRDGGHRAVALFRENTAGAWGFGEGWHWRSCDEPECPRFGREHAADIPRRIGFRDLCHFVSADGLEQPPDGTGPSVPATTSRPRDGLSATMLAALRTAGADGRVTANDRTLRALVARGLATDPHYTRGDRDLQAHATITDLGRGKS